MIPQERKKIVKDFFDKAEAKNLIVYKDFSKFVSMLINNSLYFSGLKNMKDQFEGRYSNATLEKMKKDLE